MTGEPLIDYEALTQNAMRSVVQAVLARTAASGLPGDHHFYISFDTQAENVAISKRLREKYPQEMTIVLQHRFWDLHVFDDRFEVKLTFDGIPERLVIPYRAIKVFFDPSVRYGLQFEEPDFNSDTIDQTMNPQDLSQFMATTTDDDKFSTFRTPAAGRDPITPATLMREEAADDNAERIANGSGENNGAVGSGRDETSSTAAHADANGAGQSVANGTNAAADDNDADADDAKSAEIVSLDAFRKK